MENSREPSAERPKEAVFLYSIPTFVFILDSNLKLAQKVKVANPEAAIALLARNEWLPEETAAIKKVKAEGKAAIIIGVKNEKAAGVAFSQDIRKLDAATASAGEEIGKLRPIVVSFTKKAVAASVSDDNLIIQASASIGDITKSASLIIKRLREWYELYCPEASKLIQGHEEFVDAIISKGKDELLSGFKIKEAMGASLEKADIRMILAFAAEVKALYGMRKAISGYVESLMERHCPNVAAVAGSSTGAELLAEAGSLQKLAMLPSSTIQLLGAEQALFKHLKDKKQRPPKIGVLHSHPLVTSADRRQHGRIAKILADKISIAARVDFFKGRFVGDSLLKDVKERLGK